MKTYIDTVKKGRAAYPEHNTSYLEKVGNITVDSDSLIPHKKKMGVRKIFIMIARKIVSFLTKKMIK